MDKAQLFMTGRSQAVRLPEEYRFDGTEVYIQRAEGGLLLTSVEPAPANRWHAWVDTFGSIPDFPDCDQGPDSGPATEGPWQSLIDSLAMFSDDFMEDREQPEHQGRDLNR
jgi:antitoxin VapB